MRPDASKKLAAAAPKQGPNAAMIGAVIAVVIIVGVVVAIVIGNNSKTTAAGGSGDSAPAAAIGGMGAGIQVNDSTATAMSSAATATATSSAPAATSNAPKSNAPAAKSNAPTLDVWEDFQCPGCGTLERSVGAQMASLAMAGEIKLVVHMLTFLDANLPNSNKSSARSANAAACAADAGKFLEYHAAVFAAQPPPAQEGAGYTDAQLTEFAKTSGITGAALTTWQTCTTSGQYAKYVTSVQDAMTKAGVDSTPTIKLNGEDVTKNVQSPEALVAAVKNATK